MNPDAAQGAYYEEEITIVLPRITLTCIVGACILALRHPNIPPEVATPIRTAIRDLIPVIGRYTPNDVLAEWAKVLETP